MYWYDDDKFWEDRKPSRTCDYLSDEIEPAEYEDWLKYIARGISYPGTDIDIDIGDDVYKYRDECGDLTIPCNDNGNDEDDD